ncbi:TnsD family Tn7-like transposition protein [Pullulanibacillus sp. KACC 23026]|uniref:TnsD family Tn7-like transposition protein n=1 Tax=Pullulanibacillus sp. KACC 23026 TaxID=3028315 RepID=UPI0023AED23D|nr:TnsD family Tn7-like transposition protein [Pullulanibacillus sp. KACC 23026]WEG12606.1 TnsD family Tn7-like transposition protein [Pullulanibacillus sp. KACC 23026]
MLPFFTNPYLNELIYSAIARYHFYSGNIDYKDTLDELFKNRSVIPSEEIGSHFSKLAEQLGSNYSVESILANYTIYPYYSSFLSKERQEGILQDIAGDGQGLYTRLGMVAGSICKKDGLQYCVECVKEDLNQNGEPYIHREHQLQGINYCPHHELQLRKYESGTTSRIEYVRFEIDKMNLSPIYEGNRYEEISIYLAKQAYKLLSMPLNQISREEITLKYRAILRKMNLVTVSSRIRQKELYQVFLSTFPKGFLEHHECALDMEKEYNWLKVITRNLKRHVHPFRHLLMLYFLELDVDDLIDFKTDAGPFGVGPFPCLNQAALHYKQRVIHTVEITRDFKTKLPIGTFRCSCGFVYARKGPDNSVRDQYRIGRKKAFGEVWQAKLEELARQNFSMREIARKLGADSITVKKYLTEKIEINKAGYEINKFQLQQYKNEILDEIKKNPYLSRKALREKIKKQYIFLYRHDKQWLMENLPNYKRKHQPTKKVDWEKRDKDYVKCIKKLYKKLLKEENTVRITISVLGNRLGILANLEKHLEKLPNTKKLLEEITESVERYQIRRCCRVIDQMILENEQVHLWRIQLIAAVKSNHFHKIRPQLELYLQEKQVVKKDEQTTTG